MEEMDYFANNLGSFTMLRMCKKVVVACLDERIWKKVQGYEERRNSTEGKEILICAVAQLNLTYRMRIFRLLDGLLEETHAILRHFCLGSTDQIREILCKKWEFLYQSKSFGIVRFRDLCTFNDVLLIKQALQLIDDDGSLLH